jgi:hypothetical protein
LKAVTLDAAWRCRNEDIKTHEDQHRSGIPEQGDGPAALQDADSRNAARTARRNLK